MSWDGYVTSLEQSKAKCTYAAIVGRQGGVWAASSPPPDFPITEGEVMAGVKALSSQSPSLFSEGFKAAGYKFACIIMEPEVMVLQGKDPHKELSLVFALSEQAGIVGFNPSGEVKTQFVRDVIEQMKDYLKRAGF